MHEIEVLTVSAEEAADGIAELWRDGEQIACTTTTSTTAN
jgi:hypothetical protein